MFHLKIRGVAGTVIERRLNDRVDFTGRHSISAATSYRLFGECCRGADGDTGAPATYLVIAPRTRA